jgi:ubiquinone/menaquinone biosynthesis C-methylase UbiE
MFDEKFWKEYFQVYDMLNELIPYRELLEKIAKELNITSSDLVLDAGSGTGNLAVLLENKGARVVGIDFSKAGVDIHKKKIPNADVRVGDLTKPLPFPDNHFDKVCSNNVIYTLPPSKRLNVMREFYRVLKPGGVIVVSNIHKKFSPTAIYTNHVSRDVKRSPLSAVGTVVRLAVPTVKMFWYNRHIQKEHKTGKYDFLDSHEQHKLLKDAGFRNVSDGERVYANQAVLHSAHK